MAKFCLQELDRRLVMVRPKQIWYEGPLILTQYIITNWTLDFVNKSKLMGIIRVKHFLTPLKH